MMMISFSNIMISFLLHGFERMIHLHFVVVSGRAGNYGMLEFGKPS